MLKKTSCALLFFAFCAFPADFWQSKPSAEWSEKDAQKMMSNSPWAKAFAVSVEPADAAPVFGGGDSARAQGIGDEGAGPPGGRSGGRLGGTIPANQAGSTVIVARWQSALPVKEALTRLKYSAAAGTSPEASYLIVLSGPLESLLRGNPDELKRALINASFLSAKGKGAIRPTDVQISTTPKATEVLFTFPRSNPYTLDDKEVEFSTTLGGAAARCTFRLKDMVFNGKLEL